ncbi:mitochondrial import inner membrane translocase subunit Tim21 isoform X2 [Brachyhypopomus gauderio]|uniref:mitochondrial import inner membrane translocase subunit Tim21 isoform X2 n=1 Tax=Brachyhypopomus gauderio TaxID=698409 RepID=UPI0040413776
MVCALIFRFSRTSCGMQHILSRVNVTPPPQMSAFRRYSPALFGLTKSALQTRGLSAGVRLRNNVKGGGEDASQVSVSKSKPTSGGSAAQKVKQAGTDFTYLVVVLVGLGVTGGLLYVIFQELFSSSSPSKLYGKAFDKCKSHPEVIGAFGEPIKGYGETSRRGRRQQVSHVEYLKNGQKHMRLKFYIEGSEPGLHGTVHSETKQNPETGKYEFRYIFVDVDTYPRRTIVVEDNR